MTPEEQHLRHCMLYEFQRGSKASEATKNILEALGPNVVHVRKVQRWFNRFRVGNFNLCDEHRTGRISNIDDKILRASLEDDPSLSAREIGRALNVTHTTVEAHIKNMGFVQKEGKWILPQPNQEQDSEQHYPVSKKMRLDDDRPIVIPTVSHDQALLEAVLSSIGK